MPRRAMRRERPASRRAPRERRAVDESMSLLNQLLNNPLDAGYLDAARETDGHEPRRTRGGSILIMLLAIALGIVTIWGVRALRLPDAAGTRQTLEREAETRSSEVEEQRRAVEGLQGVLGQLRATELPAAVADDATAVAAGTTAVTGPGLSITLDDAPAVKKDPANADPDQRVRDSDMQVVVNGLWGAGAEAIAVNGHRLTSTSSIRAAGSAIQVDLISLRPPYLIEAIGDPNALQQNLARTHAQDRLTLLQSTYSISVQIRSAKKLDLPAAIVTSINYAAVATP